VTEAEDSAAAKDSEAEVAVEAEDWVGPEAKDSAAAKESEAKVAVEAEATAAAKDSEAEVAVEAEDSYFGEWAQKSQLQ